MTVAFYTWKWENIESHSLEDGKTENAFNRSYTREKKIANSIQIALI